MKSIDYHAYCDIVNGLGVLNKIKDIAQGLRQNRYHVNLHIYNGTFNDSVRFIKNIMKSKSSVVMLRFSPVGSLVIYIPLLICRLKGSKVVVEIPTPRNIVCKELRKDLIIRNILKIIAMYLFTPLNNLLYTYIVTVEDESNYFKLGSLRKIIKISNPINVGRVCMRKAYPIWPSQCIELIGVAQVDYWHGYDRVLKAISQWKSKYLVRFGYGIKFNIVGNGPALDALRKMSIELNVVDEVVFHGIRKGIELTNIYEKAHIAVSSLGLYRKGLNSASELKSREYCSVGIPFIAVGEDSAFRNQNFRYQIENNNNIKELLDLFEKFAIFYNSIDVKLIRSYAEKNLDVNDVMLNIINKINSHTL
jgi:hypothetical protein